MYGTCHKLLEFYWQLAIMEFFECPQNFSWSIHFQSADWLRGNVRIAEQLPWKTESCERGVCAFAPLTIHELRTYHEGIQL